MEEGEESEKNETVDEVSVENIGKLNVGCNILQLDGNATLASYTNTDNETESENEANLIDSSNEEENSNMYSETRETEHSYQEKENLS